MLVYYTGHVSNGHVSILKVVNVVFWNSLSQGSCLRGLPCHNNVHPQLPTSWEVWLSAGAVGREWERKLGEDQMVWSTTLASHTNPLRTTSTKWFNMVALLPGLSMSIACTQNVLLQAMATEELDLCHKITSYKECTPSRKANQQFHEIALH